MKQKLRSRLKARAWQFIALVFCSLFPWLASAENVIQGNPTNYLGLLRNLKAGDTLVLEPGVYNDPDDVPGLPFFNMNGLPDKPITVTGPESGARPVFLGRSTHNTVRFSNASYIIVRNIEIDGRNLGGAGVAAQGVSHHITLENIDIYGVGENQQIVGIKTSAPAWNWVIRRCIIRNAGTGMYLGESDGTAPFVAGLIENNLILDTMGYNIQIKHQVSRSGISGMPTGDLSTIVRHNVFSKAQNGSTEGMARPNLLIGHFPLSGQGSSDVYEIYGNLFYQNPTGESLFQGEGNIALHHNLFFNSAGGGLSVQPHNNVPRTVRIFCNTVVASGSGMVVRGGDPSYEQKAIGNAVFASSPIVADDQKDNITGSYTEAGQYLSNPFAPLGQFDLFPKTGTLKGSKIDSSSFNTFLEWDKDFNSRLDSGLIRGAYGEEGQNPGWLPKMERKPSSSIAPSPPNNLRIVDQ